MAFDYTEFRKLAQDMIEEYGKPVLLVKVEPGGGPEWDPGETIVEFPVTAVDLNQTAYTTGDGGQVFIENHTFFIAARAGGPEPVQADRIKIIEGLVTRNYEVVEVVRLAPGPMILMWEVKVSGN